jgi:polar amino acid transport system permease protein
MTALGGGPLGPIGTGPLVPPDGGPARALLASPSRAPRLLDFGAGGARALLIAIGSTAVVFGVIGWLIVTSPGWPEVQRAFFDGRHFADSVPRQFQAFLQNIELFLTAEILILPLALVLAVMRSLPGSVFFPLRLLAVIYTDFFRGVPGLLIITLFGFGIPALGLPGVPNDPFFWGVVSLTLVYAAYVAEVYRAGIDSVHPSQFAAARSLGLSQLQALRFVVLPQAVRRVIPPLLNDFIGLQKDTALVSTIGVVEIFRQSTIDESAAFNFTPFLVTALFFLVITIPLARFTDVLVERDRRRRLAAAVAA